MGYRSDVVFAIAFESRGEMEEIVAVYRMDPNVQKHKIMETWELCPENDPPYMVCKLDNVKWYESYEDVQAIEHIESVCDTFYDKRGFNYARTFVRLGENVDDIEEISYATDEGHPLVEFLWDTLQVVRHIECSL